MEIGDQDTIAVYVAYLNDVNQLRTSRQTDNTTRLGVVTLLLGGQAFLINSVLTDVRQAQPAFNEAGLVSWIPIVAIALVGVVGCYFCHNWRRLLDDTQRTLNFKFGNLEAMERDHAALRIADAQLFLRERDDRHSSASRSWSAKQLAAPQQRVATDDSQRPNKSGSAKKRRFLGFRRRTSKRGVSKRAADLARFFFWLFLVSSVGTVVTKSLVVFGATWLTSLGIITQR